MNATASLSYRPEIDGLRALAVVPVVLFHAGVPGFSGGYVGVDVFFVISGFLITRIVAREIDEGRFSLAGFYARRVRRIFPALMVMLAATLAAGAILMVPEDYRMLGRTALAALFSASNILFYLQSGYFDEDAILKPLLHTWSLALEEQFYVCLPFLLLAMRGAPARARRLALAVIAVGSFVLAACLVGEHQSFAFYRLPTRAWELLLGSLLALGAVPRLEGRLTREALAAAGVAMILLPVALFDEGTLFPGPGALPPVLGAAAIIHCASGSYVGRALGLAALRGIGAISYSLYLWHWPIIVFTVYAHRAPLTPALAAGAVAASVAMAVLSTRFVERPFRFGGGRRDAVLASAGMMAVIGTGAFAVVAGNGIPQRFPVDLAPFTRAAATSPARGRCHLSFFDGETLPEPCEFGHQGSEPSMAVWGDSHATELAYALGERAARESGSVVQFSGSFCPPSLIDLATSRRRRGCLAHNRQVLAYIEAHRSIRTVVLAAYYLNYRLKHRESDRSLVALVERLRAAGRSVVVIGPMPSQSFDVPRTLMLAKAMEEPDPPGVTRRRFMKQHREALELVASLDGKASTVFPHELFCGKKRCPVTHEGKMLYFDKHHPSLDAARFIAGAVCKALKDEAAPTTGAPETASASRP